MQKADTYFFQNPVSITGKVIPANSKDGRTDAQSRPGGILCSPEHGKLCFVQQICHLQHKTTCPHAGRQREETRSEVGVS